MNARHVPKIVCSSCLGYNNTYDNQADKILKQKFNRCSRDGKEPGQDLFFAAQVLNCEEIMNEHRQTHPQQEYIVIKVEHSVSILGNPELPRKGKWSVRSGINGKAKSFSC